MSAAIQGSCDEPDKTHDELPYEKGHLWIEKHRLTTVARRVSPLDVMLLEFIDCHTRSAALKVVDTEGNRRRPEFGQIPTELFIRFTGASERNINLRLSFLEKIGYIARERPKAETHRGGYKTLPDNFRKRSLQPPKPKRARRTQTAEQRGPQSVAALEEGAAGSSTQQAPTELSLEEKIGRMVLQPIAESIELPTVGEIAATHGVALPAAMRAASEPAVQAPDTRPQPGSGLRDAQLPAAEVSQTFAAWAATHCTMPALCPFVHRASDARPTEPQPEPKLHTVGRSVQTRAGTDRPTQAAMGPERDRELAAIRAAIPEELCADLGDLPSRPLLELIREGLDGAPPVWLTRAINRARRRITSLGILASRTPGGRIQGLAVDASAAWRKSQASAPPVDPDCDRALQAEAEECSLMLEYWQFQEAEGYRLYQELPPDALAAWTHDKREYLRREGRLDKMTPDVCAREVKQLILNDLNRDKVMPFEEWKRKRGSP